MWDGESLPVLDSYCYLEIEFSIDRSKDKHMKSLWCIIRSIRWCALSFTLFHIIFKDL